MFVNFKCGSLVVASLCLAAWSMTNGASAVTVEIAKKCDALTAKAYPPREVGNPAAGSAKGSAQAQRDYFRKCVASDGKVDDNGSGNANDQGAPKDEK